MKNCYSSRAFAVCVAVAVLVMLIAPAHAFEAKVSGQVNQLVMWADNGDDSDFFIADNDNSSTRFRFTSKSDEAILGRN